MTDRRALIAADIAHAIFQQGFGDGQNAFAVEGLAFAQAQSTFIAGQLTAPLPLAVALGLFAGKQLGIFGAIWACRCLSTVLWCPGRGAVFCC